MLSMKHHTTNLEQELHDAVPRGRSAQTIVESSGDGEALAICGMENRERSIIRRI